MTARYVEQFTVRDSDEFDELEAAIGEGQFDAIVIDVPDGATAFQTAREFRRILNAARAARMKSGAIVLHPGPINRGVELSWDVADSERSVILDQVENGVAVRMAALYLLAGGE